jgi:hypothetical protein
MMLGGYLNLLKIDDSGFLMFQNKITVSSGFWKEKQI